MRRFYFTLAFSGLLILNACKQSEKHSTNGDMHHPMYHEVMAIHDKVMPEMSTIHNLKRQLKSLKVDSIQSDSVRLLVNELDAADESMMSWMATFKEPQDASLVENYLAEEKEKIQKVSDDMYKSINAAQTFLNQHNK
ncbi:MAG: hypothetical protein R2774_12710 [Saprospiraceae bacterium]